jgi:hypothetical protein
MAWRIGLTDSLRAAHIATTSTIGLTSLTIESDVLVLTYPDGKISFLLYSRLFMGRFVVFIYP